MDSGTLFETPVSDIQADVSVSGNKITGTLKYLDEGAIPAVWGAGYFMALKLTASDWDDYTSVMVGMEPSVSSGMVEILTDPDKNGVFKVTDKDTQVFKIAYTNGTSYQSQTFDLSGLTLEDAGA